MYLTTYQSITRFRDNSNSVCPTFISHPRGVCGNLGKGLVVGGEDREKLKFLQWESMWHETNLFERICL